ncbi:hypothetical protein [Arthrobacter sp. SLBN-112]|nr:hypothetical protein [Arthrobacter sp. SLBN-112]
MTYVYGVQRLAAVMYPLRHRQTHGTYPKKTGKRNPFHSAHTVCAAL